MSEKGNGGTFVAGIVVGGLIGTAIGLLVAPRSGEETRRILKKSADALPEIAEDLSSSIQLHADRFSASARGNWQETLVRLKEAIAAGVEASQMTAEELPEESEGVRE
ncbi:MAG: YtxH domain-containing protein [Snowella sp.]